LIELAVTIEEESTFKGATELGIINSKENENFFETEALINLDSIDVTAICIGSAGGFEKHMEFQIEYTSIYDYMQNEYAGYVITVDKLHGGHSGIDINSGFGNAIIFMSRLLNFVYNEHDIAFSLLSINGGNAINAIPSYCQCQIIIPKKYSEQFELLLNEYWREYIFQEYKYVEKTMMMTIKTFDISTLLNNNNDSNNDNKNKKISVTTTSFTKYFILTLLLIPHGMLKMHPFIPNAVQTSISFSLLRFNINDAYAKCELFARSSSPSDMKEVNRKLDGIIECCRAHLNIKASKMIGEFGGWDLFENSVLLQCCQNAHLSLFNSQCRLVSLHAALECGVIKQHYPYLDAIALGATIENPHSVEEKVNIQSISNCYRWLFHTVAELSRLPK